MKAEVKGRSYLDALNEAVHQEGVLRERLVKNLKQQKEEESRLQSPDTRVRSLHEGNVCSDLREVEVLLEVLLLGPERSHTRRNDNSDLRSVAPTHRKQRVQQTVNRSCSSVSSAFWVIVSSGHHLTNLKLFDSNCKK